jgi:hypothetical protein
MIDKCTAKMSLKDENVNGRITPRLVLRRLVVSTEMA